MRLFPCLLIGLALSANSSLEAAEQKLASIEVTVATSEPVTKAATGIRTLYIILHDSASQMPRPYGAIKVDLKADPKGSIYKGDVTTADIATMGAAPGSVPATLRIKARLDKDGMGGMDQPGDIVGSVKNVKTGEAAKITIDSVIKN